ncbi:MAG: discoidin domain-containing protein [Patescibacteria group bacterium]|nr:discoidin domain-containing protein [Patescibacteria group bacterium]
MIILYILIIIILSLLVLYLVYLHYKNKIQHELVPPKLTNNPSFDVILTETTPLLSFFNAKGGTKIRRYEVQLDKSKNFDTSDLMVFENLPENGEFVTDLKIKEDQALTDKSQYYWRVRTISPFGIKSKWEVSRFFVDTTSDDQFMNLTRAKIEKIEASAGYNAKNIIDLDDPGLVTFWQSPPPGQSQHWLKFDLGSVQEISRIWILSNPNEPDGWLKSFVLQSSINGQVWDDITETKIVNNDTFRNIIDFKKVTARFFRLLIKEFVGYAAQINEIILYSPGQPPIPHIPESDYILIVGNEHNGFTFTDLAKHIESLSLGLKTVTIPYFEASMEVLERLPKKPVAIVLSGNNADYPNLPMFEHNGEFEIIRQSNIPILGICAGHQFLAMAYGYSRGRSMGWSDISAMEPQTRRAKIKILEQDPIFEGVKNDFIAPEIHSWAVVEPSEEFKIIAKSTYVQAQKSTQRFIYGVQFHGEINVSYNEGKLVIENFLKMAKHFSKRDKDVTDS